MTVYLILLTAFGAALAPGVIMAVLERRERRVGKGSEADRSAVAGSDQGPA